MLCPNMAATSSAEIVPPPSLSNSANVAFKF